jgi:hypothetical protein
MPGRHGLIVKADNRHILRHAQFEFARRLQRTERHCVVEAEQGIGRIRRRKQPRCGPPAAFVCAFVVRLGLEGITEAANFVAETLPAIAVGKGSGLLADIGQTAAFGAQQKPGGDRAAHRIVATDAD